MIAIMNLYWVLVLTRSGYRVKLGLLDRVEQRRNRFAYEGVDVLCFEPARLVAGHLAHAEPRRDEDGTWKMKPLAHDDRARSRSRQRSGVSGSFHRV